MQYRTIPANNQRVSALGFGCMRFPMLPDATDIDRKEAIRMIRYAIDNGLTYVDTAYGYHGGESERIVGEALQDGYRQRVMLATKLPVWLVKERSDMERLLDEQLAKLKTDFLDVYLLHALDGARFDALRELDVGDFLDRMVKKGKIRLPGFSFHDDHNAFMHILDGYDWKVCQVQMNVLDEFHQATMAGVREAAKRGIGVIVMEPVRGGALVKNVPQEVRALYAQAETERSYAEWAFRWLIDKPEFITILSGMSSMEQVNDNLRIFDSCKANCLSDSERTLMENVRKAYEARIRVGCTGCEYCMPCPQGIKIPAIFRGYDNAAMFDTFDAFRKQYWKMEANASACVSCMACVSACPQHFHTPIPEMLQTIHREMNQ